MKIKNLFCLKRFYLLLFLWLLGLVYPSVTRASPPGNPAEWILTFSDEFTGTTLDTTKWATKMPYSLKWWSSDGWSDRTTDTGDAEWYVDDAHTINNDILSITAKHECVAFGRPEIDLAIYNSANLCNGTFTSTCNDNGPYSCSNFPYTSGMIASYPSFSQKYGYFETSMKLPVGAGMWPAFWLMPMADPRPSTTPWPWTSVIWPPEIDIMENIGIPTEVSFHSHFSAEYPLPGSLSNTWFNGGFVGSTYIGGPDFSAGFHTFGLDWEPTGLTWYVDGIARFTSTQNLPPGSLIPGNMFVIANLSIGRPGSYPGAPNGLTVFPQNLDIDYIRVYQRTNVTPTPTPTNVPVLSGTIIPTPTGTTTPTPSPTPVEVVNPADITTLPANTDVLINFNNYPTNVDGQPLPSNYTGCTWNSLVKGSPWAGINTWNFYITNGGPQGNVTCPIPILIKSMIVSSTGNNTFTLSSVGNPDVNLIITSGNVPQTLTTGWTNPVTSFIVRSSSPDQAFDDLRFITQSNTPTPTPSPVPIPSPTPTSMPTSTPSPTVIPTPTPTATPTPLEVINPSNISTLVAGTNVLINFNNFPNPNDGRAIPSDYSGITWSSSLVEGSPWAGITTWNFYIKGGSRQGTATFPKPIMVKSIVVSSGSSNIFTLSSTGNPDVSVTTSDSHPQTMVTGWINSITSLTFSSNTTDQALDDLRFTIQ